LPFSLLNPKTKHKSNYGWASSSCSILAELGTLSLEFGYISDHTGKKVYQERIDKIFQVLNKADKPEGLYYNYINPHNGQFCTKQATLGALADSFYEYLLKLWLYKDKKDKGLLDMYLKTMKAVEEKLIKKSQSGLTFVGETNEASYLVQKMGHLACFSGGLFALSSIYIDDLTQIERDNYKHLAIEITNTCHESYVRTATHLGPESFHFSGVDALALNENEKYYILRPEVVESYFYLWRMTKEQKYRDWAWDVVLALEKHCKTENGFQGLKNVYQTNTQKDDVQQSN
jgi:mannosyl-oligosaccharide alpha-1,2-mannosidase